MKIIITGAQHDQGIGFNTATNLLKLGHTVIITSRNLESGKSAVKKLQKFCSNGAKIFVFPLEITNSTSISEFTKYVEKEWGQVDVLMNNAGVFQNTVNFKTSKLCLDVNFYGTYHLKMSLLPYISKNGKIINIASQLGKCGGMDQTLKQKILNFGSFEEISKLLDDFLEAILSGNFSSKYQTIYGDSYVGYAVSKLAMNGFTRFLAHKKKIDQVVVSCCPGLCRTKMTGSYATYSPKEGADTPTWLTTNAKKEKKFDGKFFVKRKSVNF